VRLTNRDIIIDKLNELSPRDITAESREWGPTYGVSVEKFEGEPERSRPAVVRVTVHLKNILQQMGWMITYYNRWGGVWAKSTGKIWD
jgi:hypothetical protein